MKFDILVSGKGESIGMATAQPISDESFANSIGVDVADVRYGKFSIRNGMLVSDPKGADYLYWSNQGPLQMARIAQLSAVDGTILFFERSGKIEAFRSLEAATDAGYTISECKKQINKADAILQLAMGETDPYLAAYKKILEPYM